MKKRGQIFLILTILVISFMVGISAILLDIQKANYYDPAPETDNAIQAWSTTVEGLEQIFEVQLAISSSGGSSSGPVDVSIPIQNLENYLSNRGFLASITSTSAITYTIDNTNPSDVTVSLTGDFSISIATDRTSIEQDISMNLQYNVDGTTSGLIILQRNLSGSVSFIAGASFSNPNIFDLSNGAYDSSSAGIVSVTLTMINGIQMTIQTT